MRKALVVGIDFYQNIGPLSGCVNDAHSLKKVLERHSDGAPNFGVRILTGTSASNPIERPILKAAVKELFQDDQDIALLYFAGHGHVESTGGYLVTSEALRGDDGLALTEIITLANKSKAKNKIIILDSCHSGIAGNLDADTKSAELSEGLTIFTAAAQNQYALEENNAGVFTTLFVDALGGAAANLVGDITPGSIYAHIDQSLGPWDQRPLFKTNVKGFVSIRRVQPYISHSDLRRIIEFFPNPGAEFKLDPSFEPERTSGAIDNLPSPDPKNTTRFAVLQQYNRVNLVVPVDAPHMWHAAMQSKSCKLTVLGEHYWRLVKKDRI